MCEKSVYRVDKPMGLIWGAELGLCMAFDPIHYADKSENNPHAEIFQKIERKTEADFGDLEKNMPLGVFIRKK